MRFAVYITQIRRFGVGMLGYVFVYIHFRLAFRSNKNLAQVYFNTENISGLKISFAMRFS